MSTTDPSQQPPERATGGTPEPPVPGVPGPPAAEPAPPAVPPAPPVPGVWDAPAPAQHQPDPAQQYPGQQYPAQQYPGQQHPAQQYPGQQHPAQPYPGQQYGAGGQGVPGTGAPSGSGPQVTLSWPLAIPPRAAARAAGLGAGVWVALWLVGTIATAIVGALAGLSSVTTFPYHTLTGFVLANGLGGGIAASLSTSVVDLDMHILGPTLVVPLVALRVSVLAQRRWRGSSADAHPRAHAAFSAGGAAVGLVLILAFSTFTMPTSGNALVDLFFRGMTLSAEWFVPALVAAAITAAAARTAAGPWAPSLSHPLLRPVVTTLQVLTSLSRGLLVVVLGCVVLGAGFASMYIGSGTQDVTPGTVFALVVAGVLYAPNAVVAGLGLLLGAPLEAVVTGDVDDLGSDDSVLSSFSDDHGSWGLPFVLALLAWVVLVLVTGHLIARRHGTQPDAGAPAGWRIAPVRAAVMGATALVLGWVLTWATQITLDMTASTGEHATVVEGVRLWQATLSWAVLVVAGAALAAWWEVLVQRVPVLQKLARSRTPFGAAGAPAAPGVPDPSFPAAPPAPPAPAVPPAPLAPAAPPAPAAPAEPVAPADAVVGGAPVAGAAPRAVPLVGRVAAQVRRVPRGVRPVAFFVVAVLVSCTVGVALGFAVKVTSGLWLQTPEQQVGRIADALREGDGEAYAALAQPTGEGDTSEIGYTWAGSEPQDLSETVPLSSDGVEDLVVGDAETVGATDDSDATVTYSITYDSGTDTPGTWSGTWAKRSDSSTLFGLVEVWELQSVDNLPMLGATAPSLDGRQDVKIVVDGQKVGSGYPLMPGTHSVSLPPTGNDMITSSATDVFVYDSASLDLDFTLADGAEDSALQFAQAQLATCGTASPSAMCPMTWSDEAYEDFAWVTTPDLKVEVVAADSVWVTSDDDWTFTEKEWGPDIEHSESISQVLTVKDGQWTVSDEEYYGW